MRLNLSNYVFDLIQVVEIFAPDRFAATLRVDSRYFFDLLPIG